jgi:transcriptional regulator with XRE-family HTH domain
MPSWKEFEDIVKSVNTEEEFEKTKIGIDFAAKLIKARQEHNLTQAELAERAGLKQSAISRIENQGNLPRLDTVYKIAKALGTEIDFCSHNTSNTKTLIQDQLNLNELVSKVSHLERLVTSLSEEIRLLRKQSKRPVYLIPSANYFETGTYRTRSLDKAKDDSIDTFQYYAKHLIESEGAENYEC